MQILAYPVDSLFSRQQVAERSGVSDAVLGYWLREGLIRPVGPMAGEPRKHRRFDFVQINIAVVLSELHRYGASIDGLRSFAAMLQLGTEIGRSLASLDYQYLVDVIDMARKRQMPKDKQWFLLVDWQDGQPPIQHTDIDTWARYVSAHSPHEEDALLARAIEPSKDHRLDQRGIDLVDLFRDLIDPQNLAPSRGGWFWVIAPGGPDGWRIAGAEDGEGISRQFRGERSYISINVSKLIREAWTPTQAAA